MAKINLLEKQMAELIAAGEVVERPSSVVKELVENAIDAGATTIAVEIRNGGVTYLRITDNGEGIEPSEVPKAFLRHATSKLRSPEDLASIATLGFRGEALAAIAAVSRVELRTRTAGAQLGWQYCIEGGQETISQETGCPPGTTIIVRDIFFNTPARMKFLKKDNTEAASIAGVLDRMALSHPEISFRLIREGQHKLHTPGDGKLLSAIQAVLGKEFGRSLAEVAYQKDNLGIEGYITKPEAARPNRAMQYLFVNGRMVRSQACAAALEQAFRNLLQPGKLPGCVLKLKIPYELVDVNVHPAKIEVRFSDEKAVFDLIYYACRTALAGLNPATPATELGLRLAQAPTLPVPPLAGHQLVLEQGSAQPPQRAQIAFPAFATATAAPVCATSLAGESSFIYQPPVRQALPATPSRGSMAAPPPPEEGTTPLTQPSCQAAPQPGDCIPTTAPSLELPTAPVTITAPEPVPQLLGQLFATYLLVQQGDELLLIDKHAAHERLLFEELKQSDTSRRQLLLTPLPVTLPPEHHAAALQNLQAFAALGFLVEDFGDHSLLVREVPLLLGSGDIASLVAELAQRLAEHHTSLTPQALDELYHIVACKAAIKANSFTALQEQQKLLERLQASGLRHCPHGRPVTISITKGEIEKMFGRRT